MGNAIIGTVLLGAVRHAADYAPLIDSHPSLRLIAVAEESGEHWAADQARTLAESHGVPFLDVVSALARDDVDLVVVTTEPARHAAMGIRALRAGKHLLVDKPVATSLEDARRLAIEADSTTQVASYVHRLFSPAVERLRSLVIDGSIGVPRAMHLTFVLNNGIEDEGGSIIVDPAWSGGGELWNFLGYPLDTALWITGSQVESVSAMTTSITSETHRRYGVESLAIVALSLTNGLRVNVVVGRGADVQGGGVVTTTLVGSHGYAAIDENRPEVSLSLAGDDRTASLQSDAFPLTFQALLSDVVAAIRRGGPPRRTLTDGCELVRIIEEAAASANL